MPAIELQVTRDLAEYVKKKTEAFRKTNNLFLTCIKPQMAATKDIVSRWCKSLLKDSGINIDNYSSQSSRAAASSYGK